MTWWVTHWVMTKWEDSFVQGTKCSLCPLPHVHCQLHNLYLSTSSLENVTTGVIYRCNKPFFMLTSNYWFPRILHKGKMLLQTESVLWLRNGSMHLVQICFHICSYEGTIWGAERGKKINKDMEHIKSQCWGVRLTHLFSAITYSIEHRMVDKVNKVKASD